MTLAALSSRDAVALTLYGEARGEPTIGKLAVAAVIGNRLRTGRWGATYASVCLAPWQFSCWNANDPNRAVLERHAATLQAGALVTDRVLRECLWIADGLVADAFPSPVGKSTHYFAKWLPQAPAWAKTGTFVATVGQHMFFEGVR